MNAKWYISTILVIMALFGVNHHQTTMPNQQIVVQFANVQVSPDEAKEAIANLKMQLELLGADNIQVREASGGILKIAYYIDSDVAVIKKTLSNDNSLTLDATDKFPQERPVDFPSNNKSNTYNLEVHEIQKATNNGLDLEGITVVELKSEDYRIFNPNVYASIESLDANEAISKIAFRVHAHIINVIDNASYKIPEVRAGPSC